MKDVVKKVKLLKPFDIDKIAIKKDHYFHSAYIIDLPLDSTPDHVWQDIFEREWKSSRHLWDRKLFVVGDLLRLITSPDEFEEKLDWVEQIIDKTNKAIEEYNLATRIAEETSTQKLWEEKARVEMIKETLRRRFAPI